MLLDQLGAGERTYRYSTVVERIQTMIQKGELRAGERIPPERVLAKNFEVSRNCIRQAIQALSERKIVESRRGAGTYVCAADDSEAIGIISHAINVNRELLKEILSFRRLLEPQIAALAARNITREELDQLKIIVCDQERKILAGKRDSELDSEFHTALAAATKNRIVAKVMDSVNTILNESRAESLWNERRKKFSVIGHLKIIDALENRDSEGASTAMEEHLLSVEQIIIGSEPTTEGNSGSAKPRNNDIN